MGHVDQYDEAVDAFTRQLGLTSIQFHAPSNLDVRHGYYRFDDLVALRRTAERAGLRVEGIENIPYEHWDKVLWGLPGREDQLANYCQTIRNLAAAEIFVLGHHFMPDYVWRTELRAPGRGGGGGAAGPPPPPRRGTGL
jgi:mannonate dehydratase